MWSDLIQSYCWKVQREMQPPHPQVFMKTFHQQFTSVSDKWKRCQNLHPLCWTIQKQQRKPRLSAPVSTLIFQNSFAWGFSSFLNPCDIHLSTNKKIILTLLLLASLGGLPYLCTSISHLPGKLNSSDCISKAVSDRHRGTSLAHRQGSWGSLMKEADVGRCLRECGRYWLPTYSILWIHTLSCMNTHTHL